MKNLLRIFSLIFITGFFFTACEPDTGGGGGTGGGDPLAVPPSISAETTASALAPGATFLVSVTASAGDAEMNSLTITQDGANLDLSRIVSISTVATPNNPNLLFDADRTSFTYDIMLTAHEEAGSSIYGFEVVDDNNNSASESVFIDVEIEMIPPTLVFMGPTMSMDIDAGTLLSLPIEAASGSALLADISVWEEGELIDPSRASLGVNDFDTNPYILEGGFKDAFMENLLLRVHMEEGVTRMYTIRITDENGQMSDVNLEITTTDPSTPVTTLEGVLFNAGGPAGTGGLDLDEGVSTGSTDPTAEIKDFGIDPTEPASVNWLQRITGINGFEMRYVINGLPGVPENFSFDNVNSLEQIVALWDVAEAFTSTVDGQLASLPVEVGDTFVVTDGTTFYLTEVVEVNLATDSNDDNYVFNIKR